MKITYDGETGNCHRYIIGEPMAPIAGAIYIHKGKIKKPTDVEVTITVTEKDKHIGGTADGKKTKHDGDNNS